MPLKILVLDGIFLSNTKSVFCQQENYLKQNQYVAGFAFRFKAQDSKNIKNLDLVSSKYCTIKNFFELSEAAVP